ncbi:hypothetical protein [Paraburkholderia sp. SIMBA_030]|uniref:hypothetical protein n=1 Tax=Paraburkholderia sp. SIMBA_030 TaxID=3085773 RepID=UPI00397E871B
MKRKGRPARYSPTLIGRSGVVEGCDCDEIKERIAEIAWPAQQFVSEFSLSTVAHAA